MLDKIVLKLETEEEYRKALADLLEWMKYEDVSAPPYVENLIQALVNYEENTFLWNGKNETLR